jgi:hypothetical protein
MSTRPDGIHCGCSRRGFLGSLGAGFGSLALEAMRRQELLAAGPPKNLVINPIRPNEARPPHFSAKARSVIFLYMVGGPGQMDTFDYKPLLQRLDGKPCPESFKKTLSAKHANVPHGCKNALMASPFKWKQYGKSGTYVSDLFPHVAKHVDDLCFIHSMQADSNNHGPASYQMHTGEIRPGKASLGSWTTYGLGSENADLPGYVVLFDAGPLGGAANYSNGFLPASFQPVRWRDRGPPALDLSPPADFADAQRDTLDLVQALNAAHRKERPRDDALEARIASYELAYRMQSAALQINDLEGESADVRRGYGLEHKDPRTQSFGRKCLLARRLVERGVRFVQLYDMPDKDGWDAHSKVMDNHTPRARWTDQPIAGLLADLKRTGLLESTLVIWASEFGRTPMMQDDKGRQHNAAGFTVWLAGGGVRGGARIGATDEIGLNAIDRPTQFNDLHATIFKALGLHHDDLWFEVNGRQERLTGVAGSATVIPGVLG